MTNPSQGLRGIAAGTTAICTCGHGGRGLDYRGYKIEDLAARTSFEETAWLLLYGELPTAAELDAFKKRLRKLRALPAAVKTALEQIPAKSHPMDMMRTACSVLGAVEPEGGENETAERLLAFFPSALGYWHRYAGFWRAGGNGYAGRIHRRTIAAADFRRSAATGSRKSDEYFLGALRRTRI